MRILIVFATTEGHTGALCRFARERLLTAGHAATLLEVTTDSPQATLAPFDAVILAGSLHVGRYQTELEAFVRAHRDELASRPGALISVSRSAAGDDASDWAGLEACVARFAQETGWRPNRVHHAAGSIRNSRYGLLERLAIWFIAARRGRVTVVSRDYDFTDYAALEAFILDFASKPDRSTA